MAAYLREIETVEIDFSRVDKPDPIFNINQPADLEQAERLLAKKRRLIWQNGKAYLQWLRVSRDFLLHSATKQWEYSRSAVNITCDKAECGGNKPQSSQQRGRLCVFPSVSPWQFRLPPLPCRWEQLFRPPAMVA